MLNDTENQSLVPFENESKTILGMNIRSLSKHLNELEILLQTLEHKPEIIAITESWMTESDDMEDFNITGYQPLESTPRKNAKRRSGGVALYAKNGIEYKQIQVDTKIECCVFEFKIGVQTINLCILYRNEKFYLTQFFPQLEQLLHQLKMLKNETIIFGDFNIDTQKNDNDKKNYESLLAAYDFKLRNFEPTRVTAKTKSCLDHFISLNEFATDTIKTTISDHYSVILKLPESKNVESKKTMKARNMKKLKGENALNFLFVLYQKLKTISQNNAADIQFHEISRIIMECVDRFAPERELNSHYDQNDWITNKIKNAIVKRDELFQKWIKSPTTDSERAYKTFRNKVTSLIRSEKKNANIKKLGPTPTSKMIYKSLKTFKQQQQKPRKMPDLENLNNHFASVGTLLSSKLQSIPFNYESRKILNSMVIHPTDHLEVSKIIKQLKNKKSTGHDGISNEILKCCSPVVDSFLADAINKAINEHVFPETLKVAKVIPLYKKGDYEKPENYRPISLLSSISKVFEKLLYKRILKFCKKHKLISSDQYGFRSSRSCVDAISTVTEYIREAVEKKHTGHACFIDLQKAFDTLDHSILLKKLNFLGFRGPVNDLLKSYLENRTQYVYHDEKVTKMQTLLTGVPQGSVLGPLLFLIYINDLSEGIHSSKLALFADDTSVIKAGNRNDISIEEDINSLTNWFTKNKLSVNLDKCEVVPFGSGKPLEITMMSKKIPFNKSCRYLGVHIDSRLRFHEHINRVVKKLNKFCGLIYRIRHYYNKKCLLMFYNSFAKSVICYGLLIYGTSAKSNLRKIEMAQRRILRGIFFKKKYDSISNILRRNGVLTVFELYIVEVMKELFRQLQSKSPNLLL